MGAQAATTLVSGQRMDREEFIRVWHALPDLKCAELIDGAVFVPSPVGLVHSVQHPEAVFWLKLYAAAVRGCVVADNGTTFMLESSPQPDAAMWISSSAGGRMRTSGAYPEGAPELIFEICSTSGAQDLGPKLALYQRAKVQEYITAETESRRLIWRELVDGSYRAIPRDPDGLIRSHVFPGLWLDPDAFWSGDSRRLMEVVKLGSDTDESRAFAAKLSASLA